MLRERGASKRCLNRKQIHCRQRKKEETKGAETTLSRLSVITQNTTAIAPLNDYGYFSQYHALILQEQCTARAKTTLGFSVLPLGVTQ